MKNLEKIESKRVKIQRQIDASKTQEEKNRLGQYATPPELARAITLYAKELLPKRERIRFLDPAFGTGVFLSSLMSVFSSSRIEYTEAFEIDLEYVEEAKKLWLGTSLSLQAADFTTVSPFNKKPLPNLIVCNPPYTRHHHISQPEKTRLRELARERTGIELNGMTGMHGYFMLLCHSWLSENGVASWLVPSEFMYVNYGKAIREYLSKSVTLARIHVFDSEDVQFEDALVSSSVLWFRKAKPPENHHVAFTFGKSLSRVDTRVDIPLEVLCKSAKWMDEVERDSRIHKSFATLSDFFVIKRGLATGANSFFILTPEKVRDFRIPRRFLKPILPSPRFLPTDEICSDEQGNPVIEERRYLLTVDLEEDSLRIAFPSVWQYLEEGKSKGIHNRYLCRHRKPWYSQEKREPSPFLCTYMGRKKRRGKYFRFLLNHSEALATNSFILLYPNEQLDHLLTINPVLKREVWHALRKISQKTLLARGRVYGGGLHKLEPRELANSPANELLTRLPNEFQSESSHSRSSVGAKGK